MLTINYTRYCTQKHIQIYLVALIINSFIKNMNKKKNAFSGGL